LSTIILPQNLYISLNTTDLATISSCALLSVAMRGRGGEAMTLCVVACALKPRGRNATVYGQGSGSLEHGVMEDGSILEHGVVEEGSILDTTWQVGRVGDRAARGDRGGDGRRRRHR
jgi:hypothetical protein